MSTPGFLNFRTAGRRQLSLTGRDVELMIILTNEGHAILGLSPPSEVRSMFLNKWRETFVKELKKGLCKFWHPSCLFIRDILSFLR